MLVPCVCIADEDAVEEAQVIDAETEVRNTKTIINKVKTQVSSSSFFYCDKMFSVLD